ncbi:hypothetical protein CNR33_00035 [Pseudomonas phage tabernarius]|uniref:Uncharacterized protein n=1 Tax=Pseudomonas phage tabernarius TaxID=2048978 RepID=A0A2H4P6S3_9CAUD|nr:hypothetical protein FDJ17_gp35 [Pseudomonas phage tabernarius]ATW57881.1 hypothetical protein CNR33_00035 [Pseudomonas phage tabernarius]
MTAQAIKSTLIQSTESYLNSTVLGIKFCFVDLVLFVACLVYVVA